MFGSNRRLPDEMDHREKRPWTTRNHAQWILALVIGVLAATGAQSILQNYRHRSDYLFWDPAEHAYSGIKIAVDLQQFRILDLIGDTNRQVLWPPLHSYLQIPFQLLFGNSFYASSLCSLFFYALFFVAITLVYQQLDDGWPGWLVLMSLSSCCSFYAGYATMPMHEIFGATLAAFSVALYLQKSRYFPASLALLFFLKYNYCFYVLIPVLFQKGAGMADRWFEQARTRFAAGVWTPFRVFVLCYVLLLIAIKLTGGVEVGPIQIHSIGNPLYILFLIVVVRGLIKKQHIRVWQGVRGTGWEWFLLPVFVWMFIPVPNRFREMINFSINAPLSGLAPTEIAYYLFYFEVLDDYFVSQFAMLLCVSVALVCSAVRFRDERVRSLVLLFVIPLMMMTLNQNKQERYLFTFVFILWVLCAYGVSRISRPIPRLAAAGFLAGIVVFFYDVSNTKTYVAWPFIPVESDTVVDFIAQEVADANDIRILGTRNDLSPALLSYHVSKRSGFSSMRNLRPGLEENPARGTYLVTLNAEGKGRLVKRRQFPSGDSIGIYVID